MAVLPSLVSSTLAKKSASVLSDCRNLDYHHIRRVSLHGRWHLQTGRFHATYATSLILPSSSRKAAGRGRIRLAGKRSRCRRASVHAFHQGEEDDGETKSETEMKDLVGGVHLPLNSSQEDRKVDSRPLSKAEMQGMKAGFLRWLRGGGGKSTVVEPALEKGGHLAKVESQVFQVQRIIASARACMSVCLYGAV